MHIAAERLHEFEAVFPEAIFTPPIAAVTTFQPDPHDALREIVRGRLDLLGPTSAAALAAPLGLSAGALLPALLRLEAEGAAMRGAFTAAGADEWCDRRLLARMHRYTRERLRAEIRPVPPAQFMRFLFRWHQLANQLANQPTIGSGAADGDERREGEEGLAAVLRQLEGHAAPALSWEEDLLAARVRDYTPDMLDKLCAAGRVVWWLSLIHI